MVSVVFRGKRNLVKQVRENGMIALDQYNWHCYKDYIIQFLT